MKAHSWIKEVRSFIQHDSGLDFSERLILLRMMDDVSTGELRCEQHLDTVLLKLKYKVKQSIPLEWAEVINVPNEMEVSKVKETDEPPERKVVKNLRVVETKKMKTRRVSGEKILML